MIEILLIILILTIWVLAFCLLYLRRKSGRGNYVKFFEWYKECGGWDEIVDKVYQVAYDGKIIWTKELKGKLIKMYVKEQFEYIDFERLSFDECNAIGEFMCHSRLHGQWLGSLVYGLSKK